MKKTKKETIIFIIVVLISVNLCGCIDPYAADRYPTAKEAVEASGEYTVKKVYGEKELNGVICYLFDEVGNGSHESRTLLKNSNGYCMIDKYDTSAVKFSAYNEGVVYYLVYYTKFNKHIFEIYLLDYQQIPNITDSLGNNGLVIKIREGASMAYLVLDRIPEDYKISVDGIWYPIPQSNYQHFDNIPPQ